MCISSGKAKFSNTKGYVGRTKNNTIVMAYQMEAQAIGDGIRAIILQIPAKKVVKVHDTTSYANFLNDISGQVANYRFDPIFGAYVKPITKSLSRPLSVCDKRICERVGMYDVVVLDTWEDFEHLETVFPEGRRPTIQPELISFYQENYPYYKFIVATFDNQIPMSAQPFMVEYEGLIVNGDDGGKINELFHFPALDNGDINGIHEGTPRCDSFHREDHLICFPHKKGLKINYTQSVPKDLISDRIAWYDMDGWTVNGDFMVEANGGSIKKFAVQSIGKYKMEELEFHSQLDKMKLNSYVEW